jgi:integrase
MENVIQFPPPVAAGMEPLTVAQAIDLYLRRYQGADPSRPQRLKEWTPLIGSIPMQDLTRQQLTQAFRIIESKPAKSFQGKDIDGNPIYRSSGPRSPATANKYLVALMALYRWADEECMLPDHFTPPTKNVKKRTEDPGRVRYLNDRERTDLLAACKKSRWDRLFLLVLLTLTTGARKSEVLNLQWRDVDLQHRTATLNKTKNGTRRNLILSDPVIEELQRFSPKNQMDSTLCVFPSRLRPSQPMDFRVHWEHAIKEAKIRDFHFHDLRHSFASYFAQAGASTVEIATALGHKSLSMTQRYAHMSSEAQHRRSTSVFEGKL